MMAAGLIGIGAGLLPKANGAWMQRLTLIAYAVFAAFVYGGLMTMWSWPFLAGNAGPLAYSAGAPLLDNLVRFLQYEVVTGGLLWDLGRAITTSVLLLLTAPALLATLNRVATRAGIEKL
jgi:energy-coupling factor transport system substrate-specific component